MEIRYRLRSVEHVTRITVAKFVLIPLCGLGAYRGLTGCNLGAVCCSDCGLHVASVCGGMWRGILQHFADTSSRVYAMLAAIAVAL